MFRWLEHYYRDATESLMRELILADEALSFFASPSTKHNNLFYNMYHFTQMSGCFRVTHCYSKEERYTKKRAPPRWSTPATRIKSVYIPRRPPPLTSSTSLESALPNISYDISIAKSQTNFIAHHIFSKYPIEISVYLSPHYIY